MEEQLLQRLCRARPPTHGPTLRPCLATRAGAGFAFGNVPAVHDNFSLVVLGIVAVSLLPIAWEVYAAKREAAAAAAAGDNASAAGPAAVPHSTPPSAMAAFESAGLPPKMFPAAVAAAEEAIDLARAKVGGHS